MQALDASFPGSALTLETETSSGMAREFEVRLAESSTLAFRVALGVLHNREDAEDVAQEAFVRAYRNFHKLRDRERFRGWLARITWRLAIDRWRDARRRGLREEFLAQEAPSAAVEDVASSHEFQRHLARAIESLPAKLRLVLILAAIEGYDLREVALILGLPEGTVKSRLHFARKKLAESLRWLAPGTGTE